MIEDEIPLVADFVCPSCGAPAMGRYYQQECDHVKPQWRDEWLTAAADVVLAVTALPLYWCLGVRRFYRTGWPAAIAVAVLLTIGTALLATLLEVGMLALIIETT